LCVLGKRRRRERMSKRKGDISPAAREQFEQFLFEMSDVLEAYIGAATQQGYVLDYSLDSLAALERYWGATGDGQRDGAPANRASRYLGEVFRRNLGGTWRLCEKGSRYLYHGLPVIAGYAHLDIEFCPVVVFANFVVRGESGMLRRAVESHV
jgi:hypothetical protein